MKTPMRTVATLLFIVIAVYGMSLAKDLMNENSDLMFFGGLVMNALLIVAVVAVLVAYYNSTIKPLFQPKTQNQEGKGKKHGK